MMWWVVARIGRKRNAQTIWLENVNLEDREVGGKII
jgi:hypothetical protein